ncbi:MAG: hypothetical protein Q7S57_04765 [bacterium]|nr:hypothetical protein [bacterium]
MLKKYAWLITVIVVFVLIIILVRLKEDTWVCQDGKWEKHGKPTSPAPTYFCDK